MIVELWFIDFQLIIARSYTSQAVQCIHMQQRSNRKFPRNERKICMRANKLSLHSLIALGR